ncbi:MAG: hypothetical protein AAF489_06045 [Bacteroidota bacterium]
MKELLVLGLLCTFFSSCKEVQTDTFNSEEKQKNEVLVLGTIHSGHLTDSLYNVAYLDRLIRAIDPDFILAEIPPDRFKTAVDGFMKDDSISEPRVLRFPEYVDVVFPLTKEMDFEIIPTAGWTAPMARERSLKLRAISKDTSRIEDWEAYTKANRKTDSLMEATENPNDPYFIHSHQYDSIQDIGLQEYNKRFNVELGLGGWENINIAHYWNIEKALEKYRYQGKRLLIIYGAGHKGWFLRELRKRDDIDLLDMHQFLDALN